MISISKALAAIILLAAVAYGATDGVMSGTVRDPKGISFKGAFVRAQNRKNKITVSVLSDKEGRYRVENLQPGEYDVRASAVGYKSEPRSGVNIAGGKSVLMDFSLQQTPVRWNDLSVYQAMTLLPGGKGKEALEAQCFACHGLQTRIATNRRDHEGWVRAVNYMRESMHYRLASLNRFSDQNASDVIAYLNSTFGADSALPLSPAELPRYKDVVRTFSDEAMKIVYVDYELPGPNRMPFSAAPDKDGNLWMPYFGRANKIARLNPTTGDVQEFPVPNQGTAGIHSAVPAPDGTVWLAEQGSNKIGKWDPQKREITEYQDAYAPGKQGMLDGGEKHTVRIDAQGYVWATGIPLTRFDPKTGKFTSFPEVQQAYGMVLDHQGNAWFVEHQRNGKIGKADPRTGKVTKWAPPTPDAKPRRVEIDSNGIVWFGEDIGKIGRFDPKTETFKEFVLPGPDASPYAIAIDRKNRIWYNSENMDVIGCLDPKTEKITEYPFPYSENTIREFFLDSKDRMWFGTPSNNKVGYFIVPSGN